MKPITFATLADHKRGGLNLWGNCTSPRCAHGSLLDIDVLIERFGADYEPDGKDDIQRSLVCKQCHSRGGMLTVSHSHPTTETGARREDGGAN